ALRRTHPAGGRPGAARGGGPGPDRRAARPGAGRLGGAGAGGAGPGLRGRRRAPAGRARADGAVPGPAGAGHRAAGRRHPGPPAAPAPAAPVAPAAQAPAAAAAPVTPAPAAAGRDPSEGWQRLLEQLNPKVRAYFRAARAGLEGDRLVLSFPYNFHYKQAM